MNWVRDRSTAVLAGTVIGDALGGATEGWTPAQIQERYGGRVQGVVPPFREDWQTFRPISPYHKGDGHVTDDSLMTLALVRAYARARRHLDAYGMAEYLVPLLIDEPQWIPELERETVLLQRIFLPEKYLVMRLHHGHVDPRDAGSGNVVNCGAAMYMAPVGLMNAGQPRRAYAEAIDMAGAHQTSYGREAAGVFAAAVAEAVRPGASVESVVDVAIEFAHDGTKGAVTAVTDVARSLPENASPDAVEQALRDAVRPFDTVGEHYRQPAIDARLPSRTKSIEEFPVAIGLLVAHDGAFTECILGGVNYGRDADSIASMVGALAGALGGSASVRHDWLEQVVAASHLDFHVYASQLADVAVEVIRRDAAEATLVAQQLTSLVRMEVTDASGKQV